MPVNNLLLIDDDEDDTAIFVSAVEEISHSVRCEVSFNAEDALSKLRSRELSPEMIFLDLNMPIMSGQKFLFELKKNRELSAIPVVIFTTSSQPSTIQLTKDLGASDFITKPDSIDRLIEILRPYFR